MTVKVEDKRLFAPDGTPIELTPPSGESQPSPTQAHPTEEQPKPLPPPKFEDLVILLGAQAGLCMGGAPPEPGAPAPPQDLDAARHFIDLLDLLVDKTRGNLTPGEEGLLREVLAGLRLQFVRAAERP